MMASASTAQRRSATNRKHTSVNPATGELIAEYPLLTEEELHERLQAAGLAFRNWGETTVIRRCELLGRTAILLRLDAENLARLATSEMGKPLEQARAEVEKCAWVCEYYAAHAQEFLAPTPIETDAANTFVRCDPIGGVFAVMPWNFPYWQVFRFAAPALAAGNVALLKHAGDVTGVALAIEDLLHDAGFPPGVFSTLVISKEQAETVIHHPAVRAVTLTGSEEAGKAVAAQAGKAIKKCVLELGGSDPFLVLEDANIDYAADKAVQARTQNSGQSCIAAKRFIVCEEIAASFIDAFVERMRALTVGNPLDEQTDIGPSARRSLVDKLHEQVISSIEDGARLLCGGKPVDPHGCYYAATVLDCVRPEMAVLAANLDAGCVAINEIVKSDPRLPFGGVKDSGFGRELSDFGIREFVNIKTVWTEQMP